MLDKIIAEQGMEYYSNGFHQVEICLGSCDCIENWQYVTSEQANILKAAYDKAMEPVTLPVGEPIV